MKRKTFTLIEILGVVAIIAILATLGFAGYSYANTKSKEAATEGLLTRLNAAFDLAQQKTGFMPPATSFAVITIDKEGKWIAVKIDDNVKEYKVNSSATGKDKLYSNFCQIFVKTLELDKMKRFLNENNEVIDAWGNPIRFRYPGILKTGGFDLISAGPDGGFGSEPKDTPPDEVEDYRDKDNGEWICDDIAKF